MFKFMGEKIKHFLSEWRLRRVEDAILPMFWVCFGIMYECEGLTFGCVLQQAVGFGKSRLIFNINTDNLFCFALLTSVSLFYVFVNLLVC